MAYAYLLCAVLFEVLGTIAMKYSEGFTKVIPSLLIVVSYGICFVSLTIALKTLPMTLVYAIWAGAGTALMVVIGQIFFAEPLTYSKALATVLIVTGVVMLNMGEGRVEEDKLATLQAEPVMGLPSETSALAPHGTLALAPHETLALAPHETLALAPHETLTRRPSETLTRLPKTDLQVQAIKAFDAPPRFIEEALRTENAG